MFSLAGRVIVAVVVGLALLIGGVWHVASEYPWQFALLAPLLVWALLHVQQHERERRWALLDARLRDQHVPSMSPHEYEQFTARQLERAGWTVRHVGRQGDQGADVVAELKGFRLVVQCKLYRKRCGNSAVQEITAARRHYGAQVMAVVCPAGFTPSAQALAHSNGVHLLHHTGIPSLERLARIP